MNSSQPVQAIDTLPIDISSASPMRRHREAERHPGMRYLAGAGIGVAPGSTPAELLAQLDAQPMSDVLAPFSEFIVDRFDSHDADDCIIWQSRVPAGEWYFPPVNRHVITLCLDDVAQAQCFHAGVLRHGSLRAGQLVISRAGKAAMCNSSSAGRFLHMGISAPRLQSVASRKDSAGMITLRTNFALQDLALGSLLKAVHPELHAGRSMPRSFVDAVAQAVCVHLSQHHRDAESVCFGLTDAELAMVVRCLRERMASCCNPDEVAREVGMTGPRLRRRFKQRTGQTLMQYWLGLRLTKAHEMLKSTRLNVTEVAMAMGFADLPHFSRHFRRQFGMPPSALRGR